MSAKPWVKVWESYWTSRAHLALDFDALGVGVRLLSVANASEVDASGAGWCLAPDGSPLTRAQLAASCRLDLARFDDALAGLIRVGTVELRADGAVGFPKLEQWQTSPEARRKRAQRDRDMSRAKSRASRADDRDTIDRSDENFALADSAVSPPKRNQQSFQGLRVTSHGTSYGQTHGRVTDESRQEDRGKRIEGEDEDTSSDLEIARPIALIAPEPDRQTPSKARSALSSVRLHAVSAIVEAWNREAKGNVARPAARAPGESTGLRDKAILSAIDRYPELADPELWAWMARVLSADPHHREQWRGTGNRLTWLLNQPKQLEAKLGAALEARDRAASRPAQTSRPPEVRTHPGQAERDAELERAQQQFDRDKAQAKLREILSTALSGK